MRSKGQADRRGLAALAARQHGVVSIRQLTQRLGFSRSAVLRAVQRGQLHPLHRGVYAVGHADVSLHGQCLAAVLACGPHSLLSHYSAAWLWGLTPVGPVPIHVTAPSSRRARPPLVLHFARQLESEDRAMKERIPVTAVPRTILDFAAVARDWQLRRLLERAEELGLFDLGPLQELLSRTKGHPGQPPLRQALAVYRPPRFSRSHFEREFVAAVEAAGLPHPCTGWVEVGCELDVYWPELRFAVELDVFETHGTREAFERDRVRQEDLKLAGIELIRVTAVRFEREPEAVIARLGQLLAQRRTTFGVA